MQFWIYILLLSSYIEVIGNVVLGLDTTFISLDISSDILYVTYTCHDLMNRDVIQSARMWLDEYDESRDNTFL